MTMQVLYDVRTGRVMQWQDTEQLNYAELNEGMALQEVSSAQWGAQVDPMWLVEGVLTNIAPIVVIPPPSIEALQAVNTLKRDELMAIATLAINPLQDAIDLNSATPAETAMLKLWKQFRVSVNRIDLALVTPDWPEIPAAQV